MCTLITTYKACFKATASQWCKLTCHENIDLHEVKHLLFDINQHRKLKARFFRVISFKNGGGAWLQKIVQCNSFFN